jgi:hypothetical protein
LLSALVMPGLGQLAQKRWGAAAFYGSGFLAAFLSVLILSGRILLAYYAFGFSMDAGAEPPRLKHDVAGVVVSFVVAVGFYLGGLIDTWGAYRKSVLKWSDAGRKEALARITGTKL